MLIFKPIAHETVWGGQKFLRYFKEPLRSVGHLYSLFDAPDYSNIILNGDNKYKSLHDWFVSEKDKLGLKKFSHFPLVLAMVEAKEHLSLQVHPTDEVARKIENAPFGKNESWYFLESPKSGYIYHGTLCKNGEEIKENLSKGEVDKVARHLPVSEGDYVFVPAGTLHAMTAGSVVYEIEENEEYTYRLYDYDRRDSNGKLRELHTDNALLSLDFDVNLTPSRYEGKPKRERLYETELLHSLSDYTNNSDSIECITLLNENANAEIEDVNLTFGMTIVLMPHEKISLDVGSVMIARIII